MFKIMEVPPSAWGDAPLWLGNLPPPKTAVTGERYLQAICDAAIVGARWILALDDDFRRIAALHCHGGDVRDHWVGSLTPE